jgi:hypothetical protein
MKVWLQSVADVCRVKAPFIPSSLGCSLLVVLFSSHCLIGIFSFTLSVLLAGDLAKY